MVIDLCLLKRAMHSRRMSMRELFRRAGLSFTERLCIMHGVAVSSYAVARICCVLDCRQDALCGALSQQESEAFGTLL